MSESCFAALAGYPLAVVPIKIGYRSCLYLSIVTGAYDIDGMKNNNGVNKE